MHSQRTHNIETTSHQCRCNVIVVSTSYARWTVAGFFFEPILLSLAIIKQNKIFHVCLLSQWDTTPDVVGLKKI